MLRLHAPTQLGTYGLLAVIALVISAVPLYWRFVPASRRREFHILVSAAVILGFFPRQAPAIFLAIGWVLLSIRRLRRLYETQEATLREKAAKTPGAPIARSLAKPVPPVIVALYAAPLLIVFALIKFNWIALIGYSYLFLKSMHLLIEAGRQRRFPVDTLDVAHYLFFLPAFFSGPIDRLPRFRETAADRLTREARIEGLWRTAFGATRKFILADALHLWYQVLETRQLHLSGPETWLMYNVCLAYIYFDFAGYTDIAIGLGRLYGWRLCENFNHPYRARNQSQFWRSWHMSFTFWLQDYIFTPVARWFTLHLKGSLQMRVIVSMIPAAIAAMLTCGLWHFFEAKAVVWGVVQGIGLMTAIVYGELMKVAGLGETHQSLTASPIYRVLCSLLVIEFNCFTLPYIVQDLPTAWATTQYMLGLTSQLIL